MAKQPAFKLLVKFLIILCVIAFVLIPTGLAIGESGWIGLIVPITLLGLWLILVGKIRLGKFKIEGKQAFAVGGALILPAIVAGAVNQLNLWPSLELLGMIVGLIVAVILYFGVKPSMVPKNRGVAIAVFVVGLILVVIGSSIDKPDDVAGVILVNGIPLLPISSMQFFLELLGIGAVLAGIYGLIFGFNK